MYIPYIQVYILHYKIKEKENYFDEMHTYKDKEGK